MGTLHDKYMDGIEREKAEAIRFKIRSAINRLDVEDLQLLCTILEDWNRFLDLFQMLKRLMKIRG